MKRKLISLLLALVLCLSLAVPALAAEYPQQMAEAPEAEAVADLRGEYTYYEEDLGPSFEWGKYLLISLGIGLVVGLITVLILKGQLKSVRKQNQANQYERPGSMHLTMQSDIYLYRNVTRVKRQTNNSK